MRSATARLLTVVNEAAEASQRASITRTEAEGVAASLNKDAARPPEWAPGAEPVIMCMSCNHEFPAGSEELCPECSVTLTVIHRCPKCERLQSLEHLACFYCATPLVILPPPQPMLTPVGYRYESSFRRALRVAVRIVTPQLAVAVLILLIFVGSFSQSNSPSKFSLLDKTPMGQSYALNEVSLRQNASLQGAVVTRLRPHEVVDIYACESDATGNHWFGVASRASKSEGYILVQDVAPPRAADADKGARALRHSLLALGNPAQLQAAEAAVEYYRDLFPSSAHVDELKWLLAERKRRFAEHPRDRQAPPSPATGFYVKVALESGEFADSAPEAPAELASAEKASSRRSSRLSRSHGQSTMNTRRFDRSTPLKIGVLGGSLSSPGSGPSQASADPTGTAVSARLP